MTNSFTKNIPKKKESSEKSVFLDKMFASNEKKSMLREGSSSFELSSGLEVKPFIVSRSFDEKNKKQKQREEKVSLKVHAQKRENSIFNLQDMQATREEGYIEGRREALDEIALSMERYVADSFSNLVVKLKALEDNYHREHRLLEKKVLSFSQMVVDVLFPKCVENSHGEYIMKIIDESIINFLSLPDLVISCHPQILDLLEEKVMRAAKQVNYSGNIKFQADYYIQSKGDAFVSWGNGGADISYEKYKADLDEKLKKYMTIEGD